MIDWLFGTFVATSALALLVLLLRRPVRSFFGSRAAYGLWLIPAARLFMPTLTRTVEVNASAPLRFSEPIATASLPTSDLSFVDRIGGWGLIVLVLWAAIAGYLFLSRMVAFRRDREAILASSSAVARAGAVRIVCSSEVVSPIALGILDPIVALPLEFERIYAERERRLVIEHELAHHRSGDLIANLFAFVLLCLQWFNPLAWVAHAAFRFDQEAACDARVLDKVAAGDCAAYARAIAKAASGRALLFASALDRPTNLHRRLQSMLRRPNPVQRIAGRLIIAGAVAAALPLTASRAVDYVEKPAAAVAPAAARAVIPPPVAQGAATGLRAQLAAAAISAAAPTIAQPVRSDADRDLTINDDYVTIDGVRKRWQDLTPAEKAEVRRAVGNARAALEKVHLDRDHIMRSVAAIPTEIQMQRMQADLAGAQASADAAARNLDAHADEIRAAGQDPQQMKETVRRALESVHAVDWQRVQQAVSSIDQPKIAQSVANAEQSVRAAKAQLGRIEARMRENQQ